MISNKQAIGEVTAICLLVFFWALFVQGCGAGFYAAKTDASYTIHPDGSKTVTYSSNKEQQGLSMDLQEDAGQVKSLKLHVDRATTQEEVIAAALATNLKLIDLLNGLIAKGAAGGK